MITLSKHNRITQNDNKEFLKSLRTAKDEADVEQAYKRIFHKRYIDGIQNAIMNRPYGSDGYLRSGDLVLVLRMLMEFKKGTSLINLATRARIIAQVVYYLKKFELDGEPLPNVIFSGDEKEMFIVYAPVLKHYLSEDYDWSIAPSEAHVRNLDLVEELMNDPNLSSFVFDINTSKFDVNDVLKAIDSLAENDGKMHKIKVSEANIRIVFEEFIRMIFSDVRSVKIGIEAQKQPQLLVSIFTQSILGDTNIYPIPTKKNMLHLPDGSTVKLDTNAYSAFFSRYERKYTLEEQDRIVAIADQLIEEAARRFSGDFWTPTVWANRSHELIQSNLGEDWTNRFNVWDMACGTKNLTRDLQFKSLFSSTIHQEELNMSTKYNHEGVSFQYDFLNDDIDVSPTSNPKDLKMPLALFEKLKRNEPFLFYSNPPYGTANDAGAKGTSKRSIALSQINRYMKAEGLGKASQQLYAQFFYRVIKIVREFKLTNVHIAFFSKPQFFVGGKYWEGFNDLLFSHFSFEQGVLFNAGEFSDVSDKWAVNFSVFKLRPSVTIDYEKTFLFSVEHLTEHGIEIIKQKRLQMVSESESLSKWVRAPLVDNKTEMMRPYPQFSSAFNVNEGDGHRGRLKADAFGYLVAVANSVYKSQRDVFLLSGSAYMANGISVTPDSIDRIVVTFAARKSIRHSWLNDSENFKQPNITNMTQSEWKEFVDDCLIYSLFHIGASYQVSLKEVQYKGNIYNLKNEWFFMSKDEIKKLAQKYFLNEIERDLKFEKQERFVYQKIKERTLSAEANDLYNEAVKLVNKSFETRKLADQEFPEWSVKSWDAGFYQIYKIVDFYKIDDLENFKSKFQQLERKIAQNVYRLEMLQP